MKGSACLELMLRRAAGKLSMLSVACITVTSSPALSQGMITGGVPSGAKAAVGPVATDNAGPTAWAASTPLSGVVATLTDPSGGRTRRAISNREGVLSLGSVSEGTYDVAIELPRTVTNLPERQQVLVGMLVPTTQALVGTTVWVRALNGKLKVAIGPKGEPQAVTSIEGVTHKDTWDVNRFGPIAGRDLKLVLLLPSQ